MEISNLMKRKIKQILSEGNRLDHRKLVDFRDIKIETGISKNAEGSARVKLGESEVIAGVKVDLAEPYPDSEDEGTLKTVAELLPLSSPEFEPGPPGIDAIEIARVVDRGVRESGFIDFKKLCIKKGEKVYQVFLDIYSINNDGNLIDASFLAAIAALKTAKMPKYDEKREKLDKENLDGKIPLTDMLPVNITVYKTGKKMIVDPVGEEEEVSGARLSVEVSGSGKDVKINSIQKGEEEPLTEEEISKMIDIAVDKSQEVRKELEKGLKKK